MYSLSLSAVSATAVTAAGDVWVSGTLGGLPVVFFKGASQSTFAQVGGLGLSSLESVSVIAVGPSAWVHASTFSTSRLITINADGGVGAGPGPLPNKLTGLCAVSPTEYYLSGSAGQVWRGSDAGLVLETTTTYPVNLACASGGQALFIDINNIAARRQGTSTWVRTALPISAQIGAIRADGAHWVLTYNNEILFHR